MDKIKVVHSNTKGKYDVVVVKDSSRSVDFQIYVILKSGLEMSEAKAMAALIRQLINEKEFKDLQITVKEIS